jgi:hypothetical protein
MATFPQDQFDTLPDDLLRVGAHRGPKVRGRGWIAFAWAVLATGVLIAVGLFLVSRLDDSFSFELPNASSGQSSSPEVAAPTTAEPVTDPNSILDRNITITVLNGTDVTGLENDAATVLTDASWTVGSQTTSTASDIVTTVVYYSDPINEDVARGVALTLGIGEVSQSDAFVGAPVTVVVGTDFTPAS